MSFLLRRYKEMYGDIEPYIVAKMQVSVITALIVSVVGILISPLIHLLNLATFAVLAHSMLQVKDIHEEKIKLYSLVFGSLYTASLLAPQVFMKHTLLVSPSSMNIAIFLMIILVLLFLAMKIMISKKGVKAEVVSVNEGKAIVKPEYDLLTGIKPVEYVVENEEAEKGDEVRVKLNKPFLGKPRPSEIKEVIK